MTVEPIEAAEAGPETRAVYAAVETRMGQVPNFFKVLGHQPRYAAPFAELIGAVLSEGALSVGLKELLILVVAEGNGSEYCTVQHARMAEMAGVPRDKLHALQEAREARSDAFDPAERALVAFARALHADPQAVPAEVWRDARAHWSEAQIVDAAFVVTLFEGITRFVDAMGVQLEPMFAR